MRVSGAIGGAWRNDSEQVLSVINAVEQQERACGSQAQPMTWAAAAGPGGGGSLPHFRCIPTKGLIEVAGGGGLAQGLGI